ncbi:MAG: DegT/DnrJ/EryC1/StrS family aminotransferase [Acidimicrobiales bacterium]|nr:DegT/DnrJ/EryC1/StrS family aminotransferase [Acidimicrobiales bacterium]
MIPLSKPILSGAEKAAVLRVLESGMLAQGSEVAAFEEEFSNTVSNHHCVAVNSGTSALHLGLLAAGIQRGDEVIVPSFTFAATANAVSLCGAIPVFVDIDLDTFTLNVEATSDAITERTAGIMPVHLYGHPAKMDALSELANRHGLLLFEDAAQAHLAKYQGAPVGTFGISAFSFYPTKNMTSGEGGMIVTSSDEVARKARLLRNQGMEKQYQNEIVGFNNRMTDLHASIGRVQLALLAERTERRREIARLYDAQLQKVITPYVSTDVFHAYHQYTIRTENRDSLAAHLSKNEVGHGVYYPTPVHELPSFGLPLELPETTRAAKEVLSIPVNPSLSDEEVETVIEVVNSWP